MSIATQGIEQFLSTELLLTNQVQAAKVAEFALQNLKDQGDEKL